MNRGGKLSRQLFRSTAVVSSMTLLSRVLGFVRDVIVAMFFGVDAGTDAFFIAFKIPNFLRRLFTEGAFSQVFVPVLSEYKESQSKEALKLFLNRTAGSLAVLLMAVTIAGIAGAPLLIMLFAPGFLWAGDQYALAVEMLRITLPYLFFISLTALAGGILNTFGHFALPAFTPVLLNLCLIAAAVWLAPQMPQPVMALAWGVLVAGCVQLAFQYPALIRLGLLPRPCFGFFDEGVRRIIRLMMPAIFGGSVIQINLLLDTLIASFLTVGSVSWLYYSNRLVELPVGVLGVALATVILPALAKNHAGRQKEAFSSSLDWALRWVVLIAMPATLGLVLLAEPVLSTLFQYDAFTGEDVHRAGRSLMAYGFGLIGFILIKVLVPGFTARQDMRTPVLYGIYTIAANLALNVLLVFQLAHAGLALATSLTALLNAGLLLRKLLQDGIYKPRAGWAVFMGRAALANVAMGLLLSYGVDTAAWQSWQAAERIYHLALYIGSAVMVYGGCLWLSGLRINHLVLKEST